MTTRLASWALLGTLAVVQMAGQAFRTDVTSVAGLPDELASRPRKGLGYAPSRALRTNAAGDVEAVAGALSDCVKVDGTAGTCGGGSSRTFVYGETPAGAVNGSNNAFQLAQTPAAGTVRLYLNGLRQAVGTDYTIAGATVTFVPEAIPQSGDVLLVDYDY